MFNNGKNFSAAPSALGFIYQMRLALWLAFQMPENCEIHVEGADDIEVSVGSVAQILGSLKHRAIGNLLTDSSEDFWRSARIWLTRYDESGRISSPQKYLLYTTSKVTLDSSLKSLTKTEGRDFKSLLDYFNHLKLKSSQKLIQSVLTDLLSMSESEITDFVDRIQILEESDRIDLLPKKIVTKHFNAVPRNYREAVFQRLEGWWQDRAIRKLIDSDGTGISVAEINDKLSIINDEYKSDNLPIVFKNAIPNEAIDPSSDPRMFVRQLREIGVSNDRISFAIIDYFRAFEQRSYWANNQLVDWREISEYEVRLKEEWKRYQLQILDDATSPTNAEQDKSIGRQIYKWAENLTTVQIRERVSESYVSRGSFHILANAEPIPEIYWHPRFLEIISTVTCL